MNTALIVIDGVLRKTMGGTIIPEGRRLYVSLANTGRIILLDAAEGSDDPVYTWLELNGCVQHDFLIAAPGRPSQVFAANKLRREGYGIDLVITPDPLEAQHLIAAGFNTLLFTHAEYAHPDWRPDAPKGVQPWREITQRVADEAKAKAKDARARSDD